jgi:hypothetical protein
VDVISVQNLEYMICQFVENYFMNAFNGLPGAARTAAIARDKKIAIFMMKFFFVGLDWTVREEKPSVD